MVEYSKQKDFQRNSIILRIEIKQVNNYEKNSRDNSKNMDWNGPFSIFASLTFRRKIQTTAEFTHTHVVDVIETVNIKRSPKDDRKYWANILNNSICGTSQV